MTLLYRLPDGTTVPLKSRLDSGEHILAKDIASLPSAVTTDIADIADAVQSFGIAFIEFATFVEDARVKVLLEAATDAHIARLQNIEAYLLELAGAINSGRVDVALGAANDGHVAKLTDILAALQPAAGGFKVGQNSDIDTGGVDRTFTSQALSRGMLVTNISTASQSIYCSHTTGPTATNSYVLGPGLSVWVPCTDASQLKMRPSADNAAACYVGE